MKTRNVVWLLLLTLFMMQGCATLMQGSTQQITVNSSPQSATVLVDGIQRFTTPAVLELSRKDTHELEISLEGYHPEKVDIRPVASNMVAGNFIAGGLIGYAVDHSTGAAMRLVPDTIQVDLRRIEPEPQQVPVATVEK